MRRPRFRKFLRMPTAIIGLVILAVVVLSAIFAPYLTPYEPTHQDLLHRVAPPNFEHLLGTDHLGRDVLTRLLYGARISLFTGFVSVGIGLLLGMIVGLTAGYFGGRTDNALMSMMDVLLGFRTYLLAILVVAILGTSLFNLTIAIGTATFPQFARMVRSEVLSVRSRDFVEAARALGARDVVLIGRHVFPQVLGPTVVMATFFVATAIVIESSLSFLGLGPPPPTPSWGLMINEGRRYILDDAWLPAIPGFAIMLVVLAFNLLGDALRDVLDPRI
ncbi:MAG TPA: ABC transporter permease [Trueperaceae bacterium]